MSGDFVHLHVHTEYSLLDGLGRAKALVKEAQRLGQTALAITDHGAMHGVIEFFRACRDAKIKPLLGMEAYQTLWERPMGGRDPQQDKENYHLLLLARDMAGYRNLLQIASHAQTEGYYYRPRVDHNVLAAHAQGLIATTGCLGAEVPQLLAQGKEREAYERLGWYVDVFGKENFFIELQEHAIPELVQVNKVLVPWADKFGLNLIATNDVHYVREEDGGPHDVLLCVQTSVPISQANRMRMSDGSYFLKSRAQMEATFRPFLDLPASVFDNTLRVAEMCDVDPEDGAYHLPSLAIPEGYTYETYLRHLTEAGLRRLYGEHADDEAVQERKERELRTIHEMGFDVYYLIVADLCDFARSRNIWWNVRGSGAGSLVAYCTGITGIDPLKNNLIFERFLNPGRVTMPDFDLDYPDDQREEMIRYTVQKYGAEKVAQIVSFGRMKARAAVRDVGRAQGVELAKVDRIAKLIPGIPGKPVTIQDCLTEGNEFYSAELTQLYTQEEWVRSLIDTSKQLEGVARHSGIHAAAVVVADRELSHYTPLMRPSKGSVTESITQFEFPILESIGLLKVDFLGLSTLSVMREAARLIRERHAKEYSLETIPYEGAHAAEAFTLLTSGEVSGVFQVESAGMRRVLTDMKPSMFEHIVAAISLYRPGPMEYIPQYIRRMHGREPIEYKHPALEAILAETYGIIVYQEQIIQILSQLAGYTPGEADLVRRAVGKKKQSDIEKHKAIFVAGCQRNGIREKVAADIYGDIEFFARYGFNKCLPGDAEVVDAATGRLVRVEDLYHRRAATSATVTCDVDRLRLQAGRVANVFDNGVKPVYRLTTALGRQIEATANHPFYTFDGWRMLGEIEVGGTIGVPRVIPVEGVAVWPDHEVIALGHLLAEGNLCHPHSVNFYSKDPAQARDFVAAAERFENVTCSAAMHKDIFSVYARRTVSARPPGIFTWARTLGLLGKGARAKEFPAAAFELTRCQIGLLISRMWEGDGHIDTSGRSLFYATSSERLARQLQHLLLRLGIISRLRTVIFPYKEGRTGYQLFVTGNENLKRFREAIAAHFVSAARRAATATLCLDARQASGTKDIVPIGVKGLVRAAKDQRGVTWEEMHAECGVSPSMMYLADAAGKRGFTRETLSRLADYFADDDLRRYADSDLYWDRVVTIEYAGEKQTYDLEIPGTHNFVANDILVHNSHSADYAVITVQTAWLKAHYPVEFMAAQLLVERDKTEKVVNFVSECRRMGIDVLPPDVNFSGLDFEIQRRPPDTPAIAHRDPQLGYPFPVPEGSAIRFGMAAIKNVGEGPVQSILSARGEGGPFHSLEDFADRVNLQQVGKRPLECLIKAGAFDRFGKRSQLLAVLDQVIGQSKGVHDARDSGQLSIFDLMGGGNEEHVAPIHLPNIEEAPGKEKLQWEKELLGVYSISHPLQNLSRELERYTTCSCAELDESYDGRGVTLAGLITSVRTLTTKKGDAMAYVLLEDLQGSTEVVFFPRAYEQNRARLEVDSVVIVKGTAQTRNGTTNLLADTVQTHYDKVISIADDPARNQPMLLTAPVTINGVAAGATDENEDDDAFAISYLSGADEDGEGAPAAPAPRPAVSAPRPAEAAIPTRANGSAAHRAEPPYAGPASSAPRSPEPRIAEQNPGYPASLDPASLDPASLDPGTASLSAEPPAWLDDLDAPPLEDAQPARPARKSAARPAAHSGSELAPQSAPTPTAHATTAPTPEPAHARQPDETSTERTSADALDSDAPSMPDVPSTPSQASTPSTTPPETPRDDEARNGAAPPPGAPEPLPAHAGSTRALIITFRRTGNIERDKYRLKEIYDAVRDPRGRDRFRIRIVDGDHTAELSFPNDLCNITDRLVGELTRHMKLSVKVEERA